MPWGQATRVEARDFDARIHAAALLKAAIDTPPGETFNPQRSGGVRREIPQSVQELIEAPARGKDAEERLAELDQAIADIQSAATSKAEIDKVGGDLVVWSNDVRAEDDGIVDAEIVDEGTFSDRSYDAPALPCGEAPSGQ
ncbi:hypothetical protein [Streptomyces sp. bgisy034]|uniref:hypothetical protein n=1 Tax=Streptomyces sp. bgisy034 TaxID=3413774 RepID=UPI003EB8783D